MSHFATELETLLSEKKMRAADVARASGITEAALSRIRSGVQIWINPADLERIAGAIGRDPIFHARLLRAHLLDECSGPGKNLISIELTRYAGDSAREESTPYKVKLPPKFENAFRTLAEHINTDADLRNIILSLANLYEKGTLAE